VKRLLIAVLLFSGWMIYLYPPDLQPADTADNYYEDLTHLLSLKLLTLTKSNTIDIINSPGGALCNHSTGDSWFGFSSLIGQHA